MKHIMYLTISQIKAHLNINQDFHEDDDLLILYLQVAEDAISKRIDKKLSDCVDPTTGYLEKSIIQSILLLIGQFYANREATSPTSVSEIPIGFEWLCNLNKHYSIP